MSFQTGFNLVSAAFICAIRESISGLEPSSVITAPRYLKPTTVSSFCTFTLISQFIPAERDTIISSTRYISTNGYNHFQHIHSISTSTQYSRHGYVVHSLITITKRTILMQIKLIEWIARSMHTNTTDNDTEVHDRPT